MRDLVVDLLAEQPASRLREIDVQLDEQIVQAEEQVDALRAQSRFVKRALAEKGGGASQLPPDARPSGDRMREGPLRKPGDLRMAITQVIRAEPDRVWLPSLVRDRLAARGIEASSETIRATLRRMGESGELVRPKDSNGWLLAASQAAFANGTQAPTPKSSWALGG